MLPAPTPPSGKASMYRALVVNLRGYCGSALGAGWACVPAAETPPARATVFRKVLLFVDLRMRAVYRVIGGVSLLMVVVFEEEGARSDERAPRMVGFCETD